MGELTMRFKSLFICLILITGSPVIHSAQIAPNPNPVGNLLNVTGNDFNNLSFLNSGTLRIDGNLNNNNTLTNNGTLLVSSTGVLHNNATLVNNNTFTNLNTFTNIGNVSNNSTLNNDRYLYNYGNIQNNVSITNSAFFNIATGSTVYGSGTFINTDGATIVDGYLGARVISIQGGALMGNGTISGSVFAIGSSFSGAYVAPGDALDEVGTLRVEADYTQGLFNTLLIDIGGAGSDLLDVSSIAILDGTLEVNLLDGYKPTLDEAFTFLLFDGIAGNFDNLLFPVFNGLTFDLFIGDGYAQLITVNAVPIPATIWLFGSGLIGLFGLIKRKIN